MHAFCTIRVCVCVCVCAPAVCGLDGQQNHVRAFSRLCAFSCMHVRMRTNAWYASRPNKHKYARDVCWRVCVRACVRACVYALAWVCVCACMRACAHDDDARDTCECICVLFCAGSHCAKKARRFRCKYACACCACEEGKTVHMKVCMCMLCVRTFLSFTHICMSTEMRAWKECACYACARAYPLRTFT